MGQCPVLKTPGSYPEPHSVPTEQLSLAWLLSPNLRICWATGAHTAQCQSLDFSCCVLNLALKVRLQLGTMHPPTPPQYLA